MKIYKARGAGLLEDQYLAFSQCFSQRKRSDQYLGSLLNWIKSNQPEFFICIYGVVVEEIVPYPHLITIFFHEEDQEAFDEWYGKWFDSQKRSGENLLGEDQSFGRARKLILDKRILDIYLASPWVGKPRERRIASENNDCSETFIEHKANPVPIILCPFCNNNDMIQKISAIISSGRITGQAVEKPWWKTSSD